MAGIKTKDSAKGTIRTIDKAAVASQRMKQAYVRACIEFIKTATICFGQGGRGGAQI